MQSKGEALAEQSKRPAAVVGVAVEHDSSIAAVRNGEVLLLLELERLYNVRNFHPLMESSLECPIPEDCQDEPPDTIFIALWARAANLVEWHLRQFESMEPVFDVGALANGIQHEATRLLLTFTYACALVCMHQCTHKNHDWDHRSIANHDH